MLASRGSGVEEYADQIILLLCLVSTCACKLLAVYNTGLMIISPEAKGTTCDSDWVSKPAKVRGELEQRAQNLTDESASGTHAVTEPAKSLYRPEHSTSPA
jgi:hypothetical protein